MNVHVYLYMLCIIRYGMENQAKVSPQNLHNSKFERSSELFDLCKMTWMSQTPWLACHSHQNQNHRKYQDIWGTP